MDPEVRAGADEACERVLSGDVVQVWVASTASAQAAGDGTPLLSPEEREFARRFHFEKDRRAYVLGRCMARTLLARILGLRPAAVEFALGPRGKPELAGSAAVPQALAFNWAHSGTQVLLALALGRRVGVDVERERENLNWPRLARPFFCAAEIERLSGAPEKEARRLFFEYWTLKEAYLKAEGSGLALRLNAIDVSAVPPELMAMPCAPGEDLPRGICVQRLPATTGYAAALAADGPTWVTELRPWPGA